MFRLIILLALVAAVLTAYKPAPSYESFVAQVETRRIQSAGVCPLSQDALQAAAPESVVLCANFGLNAFIDAEANAVVANQVYGLLGATAELHQVRALYGPKVIPVIYRYYTEGSKAAQLSNSTGEVIADIWDQLKKDPGNLQMPAKPEELTPEQLAVYALLTMQEHGEVFLVQFEPLPDGTVVRKPVESVAQNLYTALAGGIRKLEQKTVTGQELTPYDYGGAALDVVVVYAGWKLIAKPVAVKAAAGKGAAKAGKMAKLTAATAKAGKALTVGTKLTATAALAATAYVAVTDPFLLATGAASAGGWVAEQIGLPNWAGQFIGYVVIFMAIWLMLWPLRLIWQVLWPVRKLFGLTARVVA